MNYVIIQYILSANLVKWEMNYQLNSKIIYNLKSSFKIKKKNT